MWLVENPEVVQVHFTIDLKACERNKFEWVENLLDVLHGNKWIMFHGLPDIALGSSRRPGSNAEKKGCGNRLSCQ